MFYMIHILHVYISEEKTSYAEITSTATHESETQVRRIFMQ